MQIDDTYPALRNLRTFPPWSDEVKNAAHMLEAYESLFDDLRELSFGDATAYDILRDLAARLSAITQACGPVHGWTVSQYARLRAEANRLLAGPHEFRGANWTEP